MSIVSSLLPEFDHEMATTRRLLERVPDDYTWKPHEKSMTLGELAGHLAYLPEWCVAVLETTTFDLATMDAEARGTGPESRDALLKKYDARVARAREGLSRRTDPELLVPWTLKSGDHQIFTLPRISAIRGFVMNHSIHHRGQLSVYLRLRDVPLPPIYGPSADEG